MASSAAINLRAICDLHMWADQHFGHGPMTVDRVNHEPAYSMLHETVWGRYNAVVRCNCGETHTIDDASFVAWYEQVKLGKVKTVIMAGEDRTAEPQPGPRRLITLEN